LALTYLTFNGNSQPFGDWDAEENQTKGREDMERLSFVRMQPFTWKK